MEPSHVGDILHLSARGYADDVRLVLKQGASVHERDELGNTPLRT